MFVQVPIHYLRGTNELTILINRSAHIAALTWKVQDTELKGWRNTQIWKNFFIRALNQLNFVSNLTNSRFLVPVVVTIKPAQNVLYSRHDVAARSSRGHPALENIHIQRRFARR